MQVFNSNFESQFNSKKEEKIKKNYESLQSFHTNLEKLETENKFLAEKKFEVFQIERTTTTKF